MDKASLWGLAFWLGLLTLGALWLLAKVAGALAGIMTLALWVV